MRPSSCALFMSRLIDGSTLGDAVVMAFPHNVGIWGKGEEALNCLAGISLAVLKKSLSHFQLTGS